MLQSIDRFLVLSHVIAGATALLIAPVAMLTFKGGLWHRRAGKVSFWGMAWIFCSTLGLAFFRFNPFLFVINILSFYSALTGYRVLYLKQPDRPGQQAGWIDWLGTGTAAAGGVAFVLWGVAGLTGLRLGNMAFGDSAYQIIGIIFGALLALQAFADIRRYRNPAAPADRNWWWFEHMGRFGSAYIATVTAFLVQNGLRIGLVPAGWFWVLWVLPGVIGGVLISRAVRARRAMFARKVTHA
jgi:uncharacterized membrane protein